MPSQFTRYLRFRPEIERYRIRDAVLSNYRAECISFAVMRAAAAASTEESISYAGYVWRIIWHMHRPRRRGLRHG